MFDVFDDDSKLFIVNSNLWDNEPEQLFGFDNDDILLAKASNSSLLNKYITKIKKYKLI